MKRWIAGFLFLLNSTIGLSQAVQAGFSIPVQACLNQNVKPVNLSTNASRYEWDFCQGDLALTPTASLSVNLAGNITTGVDVVFDGTNWFGFIANQNGHSILKLSFGTDLNSTPVITNLGNISGVINSPTDIKVVIDNGNWYGFVYGLSSPMISRIDFGSSLNNTPTATSVVSGSGSTNGGFDMIRESSGWMMVLTYFNAAKVVRLTTVTAVPTVSDIMDVTAFGSSLGDVALVKSNGAYFAYAVDFGTGRLYRLAFGASVFNAPTVANMNVGILSTVSPFGIDVGQDNLNYYAMVSTIEGNLIRINLGQNLASDSPAGASLGNMGVLENTLKIKVLKHQTQWFAFAPSWNSTNLYRVNFSQPTCEITPAVSTLAEPTLQYATAGTKAITLRAFAPSGEYSELTQPLLITSSQAPILIINFSDYCISSPTNFSVSSTLPLASYNWNFGDASTATTATPAHQYASVGEYEASLTATATNGCQNSAKTTVKIFNAPVANFTVPAPGVSCTNHAYLFNNTSVADAGSGVAWQWQVDLVNQSVLEDASLAFSSTGSHAVKLMASIPGCSSEITKTFSVAAAGPNVAFTNSGSCQNATVTFTNGTTGPVNSYLWDFGNGQTSATTNPSLAYSNAGIYTVVLTASNSAGCSNISSKPVTIYSEPQADFATSAPPFSCSGTATRLNDLTPPPSDSNLNSWNWNFGDTGSPTNTSTQRNPQHTYAVASDYTVSLTVTTNFSCSKTIQKTVTISQTPTATFSNSALCEDATVTFTDAASTNQAWNWEIGSAFYTTQSAQHTFNNPGSYSVKLSVTGLNNCIGTTEQAVVVPPKLTVDFTSSQTCLNQNSVFTNITNDSSDPITDVEWNVDRIGTFATNPAIIEFTEVGNVNVTLSVTTESGCVFPLTKSVAIVRGPLAAFTADPNEGEAPLTVNFVNNSLDANTYTWDFGNGAPLSTAESPSMKYGIEGFYVVELIARDLQNCIDTTRQVITARMPSELKPPVPNPSKGEFTVEWPLNEAAKTVLVLMDVTGRQIRNFEVTGDPGINRYKINITGEQLGLYFLTIRYLNISKTYRLMLGE